MAECPYCKKEMKKGFVEGSGRDDLIWVEENEKRSLNDKILRDKCVVLEKWNFWTKTRVAANYCEGCRKVIIDVPDNEEG